MAAQRLTWTTHTSQCLNSDRSCHVATHSSSTCLALCCTGRLSSSVWRGTTDQSQGFASCSTLFTPVCSCHRWNAYWTEQLTHMDWLLCWLCGYIGCWFAGGGLRWSRWLHRRHPTSWPWAATGWWASCLMSMHLVMVVQNWLGSPGPGSVGWRPIRQTREERETSEQNQTTKNRETKDHLIPQFAEFQIRLFSSKAVGSHRFSCGRATTQWAKPFASTWGLTRTSKQKSTESRTQLQPTYMLYHVVDGLAMCGDV